MMSVMMMVMMMLIMEKNEIMMIIIIVETPRRENYVEIKTKLNIHFKKTSKKKKLINKRKNRLPHRATEKQAYPTEKAMLGAAVGTGRK